MGWCFLKVVGRPMAVDNFSVLPPFCFLLHVVAGIANWGGPEEFWRRKLCGFWVLRKPWKKICGWRRSIALFGNRGCLESLLWRFFAWTKVAFLSCRHDLTLTSHAEKLAQQYGDLLVLGCYCRKAAWAWMPVRMGCKMRSVVSQAGLSAFLRVVAFFRFDLHQRWPQLRVQGARVLVV